MQDLVFLPIIAIKNHSGILYFKNLDMSIPNIKIIGTIDISNIIIIMALVNSQ
jgi:hypothetical protein